MSADEYSARKFEQKAEFNADQVEMEAVRRGSSNADHGLYDESVAGALDDFEHERDEAVALDWHERDLALDDAVGAVQESLGRRAALLKDAYPFEIEKNRVRYRGSKSHAYEFCLAASVAGDLRKNPLAKIPRAFERLSTHLVEQFIGPPSGSLHVGEPRDDAIDFETAMKKIQGLTLEWIWGPDTKLPVGGPPKGDQGLDYVVWKHFNDERDGWLFLLGQCACGEDWEGKLPELDLDRLTRWFRPMTLVKPVRSFTSPWVLSLGNLREACRGGLVFDRLRLAAIAESCGSDHPIYGLRDQLVELTDLVLEPSKKAA